MAFNQRRASITSSSSFAATVNPRRQSSCGYITAGTGGLPSVHNAATNLNTNHHHNNASKRQNGLHNMNPFQSSQHRDQSLKARIARTCPLLIHGTPRRRRAMLIMICAGGMIILIYFLSVLDIKISLTTVFSRSSALQLQQRSHGETMPLSQQKPELSYKNPDGTDMDPKSIFMIRDFGSPLCLKAFERLEHTLPQEIRQEREQLRNQEWKNLSKQDAYTLSLAWKRNLKQNLPNWKEFSHGWVGQGVVLGAFPDSDGKNTTANTLLQIKLIRSISSIPIEVWFERADDVSEELQESIATWGATIRSLDDNASTAVDAIVLSSDDEDGTLRSPNTPISSTDIQQFKARADRNLGQLQKALTIAALVNSGFEDIIYFSPSTLPMQSPRVVLQHPDYIRTGAVFWQHPTSFPAGDNPLWRIIQGNCDPAVYEQSWSSFALRHRDAWKGLYLAWYWLTGEEHNTYERIFSRNGNDLLRAAWIAVSRPYTIIDKMPHAGLLDLSRTKGDGMGCSLGSTLYPTPGADVLDNPRKYADEMSRQQRLYQKSYRYGDRDGFFMENQNIMMVDTGMDSLLTHAGSNDRSLHEALDSVLTIRRDPTRLILTDAYAAGLKGRVCIKIARKLKGHTHE
ncbi:hypothetical protein BX616_001707 [Lobosporangium transversale]|uniref:Mannosyltransferase putative-domain-containing protein n=1 Tax=Lobosporangium transversale TaxID=64571 RepID=A0A1Y2GLC1_9FUNG|nr:hypothetical protein BCR41DRAFT_354825 [Lobosporangium transversale]KAF9917179.1 hypothetical protein BX616_001707 [Lobosporangium transversale]ORZ14411.1 hypothetical protein BCR41DRAFT_354825 [Lobosporangium transversale]|eukprot:XP_021880889.1 hypothetical protein BCR41DRAFT_354825 [Lobosporangium transversale]